MKAAQGAYSLQDRQTATTQAGQGLVRVRGPVHGRGVLEPPLVRWSGRCLWEGDMRGQEEPALQKLEETPYRQKVEQVQSPQVRKSPARPA